MMKLYEFGISRSARAQWALREAGVEYETVSIDLTQGVQNSPEFLAINPYGKLPVLVDGDITVTESAAICTYIAEKFPAAQLIPEPGTAARAHYYQWVCFCLAEMEPHLWSIRKNMIKYPKPKRSRLAIEIGREEYAKSAAIIAAHLAQNDYLLGKNFSAADIIVGYDLVWADSLNLLADIPLLKSWLEKLMQRPAFPSFLFTETVRQGKLS